MTSDIMIPKKSPEFKTIFNDLLLCTVPAGPALLWTPEAFPGPNLRFPRKASGSERQLSHYSVLFFCCFYMLRSIRVY